MFYIIVIEHLSLIYDDYPFAQRIHITHIMRCEYYCCVHLLVDGMYKSPYITLHRHIKSDSRFIQEAYLWIMQE